MTRTRHCTSPRLCLSVCRRVPQHGPARGGGAMRVNLKQAAQYLGVHSQTASKLVRSGRLAAVCVGARYEISEAAIERYLAERRAMRRSPLRREPQALVGTDADPLAAARAALDAPAVSADAV